MASKKKRRSIRRGYQMLLEALNEADGDKGKVNEWEVWRMLGRQSYENSLSHVGVEIMLNCLSVKKTLRPRREEAVSSHRKVDAIAGAAFYTAMGS